MRGLVIQLADFFLVHDVCLDEDSPTSSSKSDLDDDDASVISNLNNNNNNNLVIHHGGSGSSSGGSQSNNNSPPPSASFSAAEGSTETALTPWSEQHRTGPGERRRRRLPEIPKNKKSSVMAMVQQPSLADELGEAMERGDSIPESLQFAIGGQTRPLLVLKCHNYLRDEDSSPDSERFHSTDVDSGNSTAHSPDGPKSTSPQPPLTDHVAQHDRLGVTVDGEQQAGSLKVTPGRRPAGSGPKGSLSPESTASSGGIPFTQLELLEATHRGLHKFIPRHHDEIEVEIGDPIYVQKEADDLWCEGVNLRSGQQGIFPSAYAVDVDYNDFDPSTPKVKRERYLLGYLGSVETRCHKGNSVLCQAVRKIVGSSGVPKYKPHSCILEVSDQGLRMVDRRKPSRNEVPCHDYFYSLKNVSFCAFHPRDNRYMGFITKHPQLQRFACHVFLGTESTRPVAEAVGRAFQRFYTKFIETAYPTEDIYIE
ncbi:JNK-interacting protein 1 isoform X2 [Anabrus simplex]|uniref:JNK-interacting protein 1 isoform X2 n=1 Tax=Anabrus simplex TaxID=316456 RepID=UPI0035A319C8